MLVCLLIVGAISGQLPAGRTEPARVLALTSLEFPAYNEAIRGLQEGATESGTTLKIVNLDAGGIAEQFREFGPELAISIGSGALTALGALGGDTPVLSTMVFGSSDAGPDWSGPVSTVTLDIPFELVAQQLEELFPTKRRLGIIHLAELDEVGRRRLSEVANRHGLTVSFAEAEGPSDLLNTFRSLQGKVDFVWCRPIPSLYNSITVRPLIRLSLKIRLPIVAFSEAFVRSGAALGVYPDFYEIGVQTAALADRFHAGLPLPVVQEPRRAKVAVNQRVLRLLGMTIDETSLSEGQVMVLK